MNHDELQELVAGYAVGGLEPREVACVEAHLAECSDCRRELVEHQNVLRALLLRIPEQRPPPRLRESVLAAVRDASKADEDPQGGARRQNVHRHPRWILPVVAGYAAVATVAVVFLAIGLTDDRSERDGGDAIPSASFAVDARRVETTGALADARASVVRLGSRRMLLVLDVPTPPADRVWKLWGLSTEQGAAPSAITAIDDGTSVVMVELGQLADGTDMVSMTLERSTDIETPEGTALMRADV